MSPELVLLLAYSAGLVGVGVWMGRRVSGSGSFFVADRRLSGALLFSTFLAMNIGAGSTIGAAGLGYRDGLAAWWWVGSAGIGTLVLALWVGPRIWRIAKRHELLTVGDFLEHRYGPSVRVTVASLLWMASLPILAGQLIAMSDIFEVVAGAPRWSAALISGAVITIYFTAGGLLSSAWVNLVELVVLLLGFAIAVPWALAAAGGWDAVVAAAPATSPDFVDFWSGGASGIIYLPLLAPAFIVSPGLIQKVYGAVDERAIRIGLSASAVALMGFALAPTLFGMIARVYDPALANPEHALQTVLLAGLPTALGALGLAAVFSAEVSSADAVLFMLSTSLSKDLYKRFVRPDASDASVVRVARASAILGGVLGTLLALVLPSVISSLTVFYAVLGVSLFVPVVAGLHSRKAGIPEALAAVAAGLATLVALTYSPWAGAGLLRNPSLMGILLSGVAFLGLLLVRRGGARSREVG